MTPAGPIRRSVTAAVAVLALGAARPAPSAADPVADFYKGRQINMIIAHEVATGYDIYARTLARHMGRHIPGNPTIVPQNMLGASGITGANLLFNVSPKDGSAIGTFAHTVPLDPLIGQGAAKFDASRFNYLGNMEESIGVCAISADAGIASLDDLIARETRFGATATTGPPSQMAAALKNLLGGKVRLIHGYKGAPGVKLAIEKGEVAGICGMPMSTLRSQWADVLEPGRIKPFIQLSGAKGAIPGVEHVYDRVRNDEDRQVFDLIFGILRLGKIFAAPPGVPAERVAALRKAFDAAMKDPELLADAARQRIDISPSSGEAVAQFIAGIYKASPEVVARAKKAVVYE
jgi:tripartite-type tricarboxylate transporter receptor subunit TctC